MKGWLGHLYNDKLRHHFLLFWKNKLMQPSSCVFTLQLSHWCTLLAQVINYLTCLLYKFHLWNLSDFESLEDVARFWIFKLFFSFGSSLFQVSIDFIGFLHTAFCFQMLFIVWDFVQLSIQVSTACQWGFWDHFGTVLSVQKLLIFGVLFSTGAFL